MPKSTKVRISVPQDTGEIVITTRPGDPDAVHRFAVTGGFVEAPDQAAAELIRVNVEGSVIDAPTTPS